MPRFAFAKGSKKTCGFPQRPRTVIAKREENERCGNPKEERARLPRLTARNDKGVRLPRFAFAKGSKKTCGFPQRPRTVIAKREEKERCGNPKKKKGEIAAPDGSQ